MPKEYGYGGESASSKSGAAPKMKDQGSAMMKHGKGPHMSAQLKYNAIDDITQGKGKGDFPFTHKHTSNSASMMVDKSSPAGMHTPLHEGHKGGMPMNQKGSAMPMYGPAKMYGKKK